MAKFAYDKQDQVINQFQRDIRSSEKRDWLTATEQAILQGQRLKAERKTTSEVRTSTYNPNNPLNGSSTWNREQWNYYKQTGKNPITKK
jgi:hypothetical protein